MGENAIGVRYGIKGGLGEVTQGGRTAPGQGIAITDAGHLRHSCLDDNSALAGRSAGHQHRATEAGLLESKHMELADLVPQHSIAASLSSIAAQDYGECSQMLASQMAMATSWEHLTLRTTWPLKSLTVTNALILVHWPAQVCFYTGIILKVSS